MREFSWYSILRQLGKILHGVWRWHSLRRQYHLDYAAALLVLPESDDTWNRTALEYYPDYLARKCVTRAVVLYADDALPGKILNAFAAKIQEQGIEIAIASYPRPAMDNLLAAYCLYKFYDNLVLLYRKEPRDNRTELVLAQGNVTMAEWIALGVYHLRQVPEHA